MIKRISNSLTLIGLALLLALGVDRAELEKLKKAGVNPLVERGLMSE